MADLSHALFTDDERSLLETLDLAQLPRHIAIVMDGNGRWATRQHLPRVLGHQAGVESVRRCVRACASLGIDYLTLYSFSTENWRRPALEVAALMQLIERQMRTEVGGLHQEGIRVRHLGRRAGLPASLLAAFDDAAALTAHNPGLTLQFAINYSGRTELVDAVRHLAAAAVAGDLDPAAVDEAALTAALYAPDIPDPDLCIRTAGEMRLSNFLLWQCAYAEYWSTPVYWPDFGARHLLEACRDFQHRQRKFGGL